MTVESLPALTLLQGAAHIESADLPGTVMRLKAGARLLELAPLRTFTLRVRVEPLCRSLRDSSITPQTRLVTLPG